MPKITLRHLIYGEVPAEPKELTQQLGAGQKRSKTTRELDWASLPVRVYFYDKILADPSDLPEDIVHEIRLNRLYCLVLLLSRQVRSRWLDAARDTAVDLLDDDISITSDEVRQFLGSFLFDLALLVDENADKVGLGERLEKIYDEDVRRAFLLTKILLHYSSDIPNTIENLSLLAETTDRVGLAANYALALIYGEIKVSGEEQSRYERWLKGIQSVYGKTPARLAAGFKGPDQQASREVILSGATKLWVLSRKQAEKTAELKSMVKEFTTMGLVLLC